jgi:hypothetical protein
MTHTVAPGIVQDVLRSPGQPLDPHVRSSMESRFGHDFGSVRVHTGGRPSESAEAIGARAYTAGRDIVFGDGQYAPAMRDGRALLAHELAHVVQQRGSTPAGPLTVGPADSPYEQEARAVARHIHSDRSTTVTPGSQKPDVLQRELVAYKEDEQTILPTGPEVTMSVTYDTCTGSADELTSALQPLVDSGDVLATDDGKRVFFAHTGANVSDLETAFTDAGYSAPADMARNLSDDHNVYLYCSNLSSHMTTLFWTTELSSESEHMERQTSRLLTHHEKQEAYRVFGDSLDYDRIRVSEDPVMSFPRYARTLPSTVYFPPGGFSNPSFLPWLIHELTHSWQYQHGVSVSTTLYHAIASSYDYGGEQALIDAHDAGQGFTDFNTEQQGDITRDYYRALVGGGDVSAFQPFIDEIQGS